MIEIIENSVELIGLSGTLTVLVTVVVVRAVMVTGGFCCLVLVDVAKIVEVASGINQVTIEMRETHRPSNDGSSACRGWSSSCPFSTARCEKLPLKVVSPLESYIGRNPSAVGRCTKLSVRNVLIWVAVTLKYEVDVVLIMLSTVDVRVLVNTLVLHLESIKDLTAGEGNI